MSIARQILESIRTDKQVRWEVKSPNHWAGSFAVGPEGYHVDIRDYGRHGHTLEFSTSGGSYVKANVDLSGGESLAVFGYVVSALHEYLKEVQPKELTATSDEPEKVRVYKRIAKVFMPKAEAMGYSVTHNNYGVTLTKMPEVKEAKPAPLGTVWAATAAIQFIDTSGYGAAQSITRPTDKIGKWKTIIEVMDTPMEIAKAVKKVKSNKKYAGKALYIYHKDLGYRETVK